MVGLTTTASAAWPAGSSPTAQPDDLPLPSGQLPNMCAPHRREHALQRGRGRPAGSTNGIALARLAKAVLPSDQRRSRGGRRGGTSGEAGMRFVPTSLKREKCSNERPSEVGDCGRDEGRRAPSEPKRPALPLPLIFFVIPPGSFLGKWV